jgi:CRP-like cAMP-binding protein
MSLDPSLIRILGSSGTHRHLPARATLYWQGEPCQHYYLITAGWVAQSAVTPEGGVQILDFATPCTLLGMAPGDGVMHHTAQCLTQVEVRSYPRAWLHELMDGAPGIGRMLFEAACAGEARAHDRVLQLGLHTAHQRVMQLLTELCLRINARALPRAGESLVLPLTQRHIAQATGLSGEHVNRTLRHLREQGVLRFDKRRLHILSPQALWAAP